MQYSHLIPRAKSVEVLNGRLVVDGFLYTDEEQRIITTRAALEDALESQAVSHYFTLTSARRMSAPVLRDKFFQWIDSLEASQRRPLAWFRADETRWSGLGDPGVPLHFHGLLIGEKNQINLRKAEEIWDKLAGDPSRKKDPLKRDPNPFARVCRYSAGGGAAGYVLKEAQYSQSYELGGPWRILT